MTLQVDEHRRDLRGAFERDTTTKLYYPDDTKNREDQANKSDEKWIEYSSLNGKKSNFVKKELDNKKRIREH